MLAVGDKVPEFEGESSTGETMSRAELLGSPYVLFFYPKSFTSGCTLETREFAKKTPEIEALGARVIGVSIDKLDTQCKFADKLGAEFPIVADKKGKISKAFGVKRPLLPLARRVTYVIDADGVVDAVFASETQAREHIAFVIEHLGQRA